MKQHWTTKASTFRNENHYTPQKGSIGVVEGKVVYVWMTRGETCYIKLAEQGFSC